MRPSIRAPLGIAFLAVTSITAGSAQAQTSLQGAWIATAWESGGTPIGPPQRGLLVFTKNHYSMMFVTGGSERPGYAGESLTDTEKLAAYDSFIANAGIYTVSGNTITTKAYMAKDPNYMRQWTGECATGPCPNDTALEFRIDGTTLHVTWPASFGGGRGLKGTFRRVE